MSEGYGRPTVTEVLEAITLVAAVVPFFPTGDLAVAVIAEEVHRFIGTREQLDWFQRLARGSLSKFEGVPQLRALFCTKYAPFDGVEPIVECAGFEEAQLENAYQRRVMDENDARLAQYRREALLAPAEDRAPLELPMPEVKQLPPAPAVVSLAGAMSAGAQLEVVEAAIRCPWCAEGIPRVRSSVSANYVHIEVPYAGRVRCKNPDSLPSDLKSDPAASHPATPGG